MPHWMPMREMRPSTLSNLLGGEEALKREVLHDYMQRERTWESVARVNHQAPLRRAATAQNAGPRRP